MPGSGTRPRVIPLTRLRGHGEGQSPRPRGACSASRLAAPHEKRRFPAAVRAPRPHPGPEQNLRYRRQRSDQPRETSLRTAPHRRLAADWRKGRGAGLSSPALTLLLSRSQALACFPRGCRPGWKAEEGRLRAWAPRSRGRVSRTAASALLRDSLRFFPAVGWEQSLTASSPPHLLRPLPVRPPVCFPLRVREDGGAERERRAQARAPVRPCARTRRRALQRLGSRSAGRCAGQSQSSASAPGLRRAPTAHPPHQRSPSASVRSPQDRARK